ncbi:hypothetical protein EYC80_006048 [Monilinia laxa]|uniref:Uncharacterized protein n=1 Tax=Monilinia laxa TaxID=61186 RepID=A0A5N6KFY3_MONLA|nr:hypothetical protein EYC80_006048 [Monilinia laxa]
MGVSTQLPLRPLLWFLPISQTPQSRLNQPDRLTSYSTLVQLGVAPVFPVCFLIYRGINGKWMYKYQALPIAGILEI